MDTGVIEGGLNVTLTIRLLMHGKEVGSIIGKDRYSSGSASYPHTAPSMCLNSDLEGPPQEATRQPLHGNELGPIPAWAAVLPVTWK
ncbi:hypothetical protein AV530_008393 [Patagioenas fasciata monilis]|uniref:Uncharacterized protein n=1 Tax=Patagioenas fasciata monilis TaxID=372326 RepID=A0A1V4JIB0_PATFA|nr:hypothetical protein AV530_008393 [Patagioenas fasciata monilis]